MNDELTMESMLEDLNSDGVTILIIGPYEYCQDWVVKLEKKGTSMKMEQRTHGNTALGAVIIAYKEWNETTSSKPVRNALGMQTLLEHIDVPGGNNVDDEIPF